MRYAAPLRKLGTLWPLHYISLVIGLKHGWTNAQQRRWVLSAGTPSPCKIAPTTVIRNAFVMGPVGWLWLLPYRPLQQTDCSQSPWICHVAPKLVRQVERQILDLPFSCSQHSALCLHECVYSSQLKLWDTNAWCIFCVVHDILFFVTCTQAHICTHAHTKKTNTHTPRQLGSRGKCIVYTLILPSNPHTHTNTHHLWKISADLLYLVCFALS